MLKLNFLFLIFLIAILLRLSLLFIAYHGDLNNNISWGTLAVERGLSGFYEGKDWPYSAPNQPPFTILVFAGARIIWQLIENVAWWLNSNFPVFPSTFIWFWESRGMTLLVKLPAVIADLGIGWFIFQYFARKKKENLGLKLSALWFFNPISWYNSSVWGQTDGVVNFLGLAAVLFLLEKRLVIFSIFFVLSLLFKGSLFIFTPVLFFVALWQKHKISEWTKSISAGLATVLLISIWFYPKFDFFIWLINLYQNRILPGEIGFLTANAFNFWWLVDSGRTLDSTVYFNLPARIWGLVIALGGITAVLIWLKKGFSDKRVFCTLAIVALLTFLFMTRIHERYLYPFFPSATILLGLVQGLFLPYIILSVTHLLNLYHLFWAPSFPPLETIYNVSWFIPAISIINIFVFFGVLLKVRD